MRDYGDITKTAPEKYCAFCGKLLHRKRFNGRLEDYGVFIKRKYCDVGCMRRSFVKKDASSQNYRESHHSARMIAFLIEVKQKVCEMCGSNRNIDIHHKDGNFRNNSPDNLMVVCRSCHLKLHNKESACKICGKPVKGLGYCNLHYIRFKKYGNPLYYQGRIVSPTHTERKMFIETGTDIEKGEAVQGTLF